MVALLAPLCWACCTLSDSPALGSGGSFLYQPAFCLDAVIRGPAEPYVPQPGDIFLATDKSALMRLGHDMAWAGAPHHSAIVFLKPDGRYAILEAGPHNSVRVEVVDLLTHLNSHERDGELVWIRRRSAPLTPEQSARLTTFAMAQDGKPFATWRMLAQVTFLLRTRGPIRTTFVGKPHGERNSYFCSELVTESCVAAGLLDAASARPSATYPHDLFFGRSLNPVLNQLLTINECWCPPARWTSHPFAGTAMSGNEGLPSAAP
jgi:hypothetical protein